MNIKVKPFIALVAVVVIWGFSFLSTKRALASYSPSMLGLLRNAWAVVFLIPVKIWDERRGRRRKHPAFQGKRLSAGNLLVLALAGFSGISLYFVFENNGIARISVSEAAIFTAAIPVLVMLCESVWLKLAGAHCGGIKRRQWAGAFISILGVVMVSGAGIAMSGDVLGYLFMTGAACCWTAYCFLTRGLFNRASYIKIVFWQTFFGFIGFIPFCIAEICRAPVSLFTPPAVVWLHLLFLAVVCSAFCYVFYAYALEELGAAASSLFINLIPVVTIVAGFFLMDDRLSIPQWLGAGLTLIGVYMGL